MHNIVVNRQICQAVIVGGGFVENDQIVPAEIPHIRCGGVDHQRSTDNDHCVCRRNGIDCTPHGFFVKRFFVQHHIGLDDAAAFCAVRHAVALRYRVHAVKRAAVHTVVAQYAPVNFIHAAVARRCVQTVNVLRDDRHGFAFPFQIRKKAVRRVGQGVGIEHFGFVEIIKQIRMRCKKGVADDFLGRDIQAAFLVVKPVRRAKIGYARRATDARTRKHANVTAVF